MPVPHTRSARKTTQMYLKTLRPLVYEIAAALPVPDTVRQPEATPGEIGAAYLGAFLDDLHARLGRE
jgi:hypothetical protein